MGTNYYVETEAINHCPMCHRCDPGERLHIGKSSAGWVFAVHVIPSRSINTLEDWKAFILANKCQIVDEYGGELSLEELLDVITNRSWPRPNYLGPDTESGPNNLLRSKVRPGLWHAGPNDTWEYCDWEFS